jgi:hypothetical protein
MGCSRDDLRIRSDAVGFSEWGWGSERPESAARTAQMITSLKRGSKVFEFSEGGAAARKAGRRKLNVFATFRVSIDLPKTSIDYR